jgi:hypothetical protein
LLQACDVSQSQQLKPGAGADQQELVSLPTKENPAFAGLS